MKRSVAFLLFILACSAATAFGQSPKGFSGKLWREIDDAALQQRQLMRPIVPRQYRTFALDQNALKNLLQQAPMEFTEAARSSSLTISLPMPDGTFARFAVAESPVMEAELALKHPDIKTYSGTGIDDPTATARFGISPSGFNSMILSSGGTILVDRYAVGDTDNYISYFKNDVERAGDFICDLKHDDTEDFIKLPELLPDAPNVVSGTTLRTYRLALAATGEYTNVFRQSGDTDAQARSRALDQMVLIMNRVNGVYMRDVAIKMVLSAREDSIIYTDPVNDPYTNENGQTMLGQNQSNLDSVIGTANYDIGHVFSTGGGGIASLQSPCTSTRKAQGVTGLPNPVGDAFAIDYVAHEMGHQFGGNHTFNIGVGSCGAQRAGSAAYEPGSAITIMGYAGICGNQDLAAHSIDTFHVKSIEEMVAFSTGSTGNSCAVSTTTGNTPPVIDFTPGYNVPKQTPFTLTASASDADNDPLTYDWEQYNAGAPATTPAGNSDTDGQERPLFRPYLPISGTSRTYPSLPFILNNANVPPTTTGGFLTGEILPSISRTMLFQVVVRDNRTTGGGVRSRTTIVQVNADSGPFVVTAPDSAVTWAGNSQQTVTWNVANTNAGVISATNVKISLSTDGGNTFPTVLKDSTPNDGTETITVPNTATTQARIKVEAVGNIFFDISGANFTITASAPTVRKQFDFDGDGKADISVFRPSNGSWYVQQSTAGFTGVAFGFGTDKLVPADYDGDGKTDIAVYRNGTWYLLRSQLGFTGVTFGDANDIPVPADYDGDGKADIAVFRPSNGTWYLQQSTNGFTGVAFGISTDKPVPADYDGDGKADIAVNRSGTWYIQRSQLGFTGVQFGDGNDKLVPADYDGDGKTDVAVFRPSNGTWYLQQSTAGFTGIAFGLGTDLPAPADYDGDGKADVAVFRSGTWYIQRSQAGFTGVAFGASTDAVIPNTYVR